jgi:hypothetical protein
MAQIHFFTVPGTYMVDECIELATIINKAFEAHGLPDHKAFVLAELKYAGLSVELPDV